MAHYTDPIVELTYLCHAPRSDHQALSTKSLALWSSTSNKHKKNCRFVFNVRNFLKVSSYYMIFTITNEINKTFEKKCNYGCQLLCECTIGFKEERKKSNKIVYIYCYSLYLYA